MVESNQQGKALVLGSIAFDYIMNSPEDYYDALSIDHDSKVVQGTFLSIKKVVHFGGTAGNIAYSMALLGGSPIVTGCVGTDFKMLGYEDHLKEKNVDLRIECIDDDTTASCYIFNDVRKNQLTIFHSGALNCSDKIDLASILDENEVKIAINAPNNMAAMVNYSRQLKKYNIPAIFDPGQMINALTPEQFEEIFANSSAFISNEHELRAVNKRFGMDPREATDTFDWVITTKGSSGSEINARGEVTELPIATASAVVDPTGAGDSFRGALLYGLAKGLDIVQSAKLGVVMGSMKVEHPGGQMPSFDVTEFEQRYRETFEEEAPL
ncbi:MAG TPA: carbohydrate kinase family protein [Candidatus Lokiarchaeia archaeon]|nr:carbohydrate kinase family protein [Candidatus Lokiarchaeia archaeon]